MKLKASAIKGGPESGIVLIVCLCILLMLSLIGIATISTSETEMEVSNNYQHSEEAFYAADGGAERALSVLADTITWRDGFSNQSLNNGSYTVTILDSTSMPSLGHNIRIQSVGMREGARKTIEIDIEPIAHSVYDYAVLARNGITFSSSVMIDSYDSRNGTYLSQRTHGPDSDGNMFAGSSGPIRTNGTIFLQSGDQIHGGASTATASGMTLTSGSRVYGDTTTRADSIVLPPIAAADVNYAHDNNQAPAGLTITGGSYNSATHALTCSGGTITMASGTYYFSSINLQSSARLILQAGASVIIYVAGNFTANSSVMINDNGNPNKLRVYSTGGTFQLASSGRFFGSFYGPDTDINVPSGSEVFGSLVGRTTTIDSGSKVHYDTSLGSGAGAGSVPFQLLSWRQF